MKIYLFSLSVVLLLSGCVGIGIAHRKEWHNPNEIAKSMEEVKRRHKGEPQIKHEDNKEVWTYKKESAHWGIVPIVVIPIPLVLPVGTNYDRIEFENGKCVKEIVEYNGWTGFRCGLLSEASSKMGCTTLK